MLRTLVASLRMAVLALVTAASAGCASSPGEPEPPAPTPLRLLFIGNSLTYFHQLPELVQQLGASDPSHPVEVTSVAFPDYSLEDHWNRGDALTAIAAGGWDYVLLQQGPSALPESRVLLVDDVTRFAAEIRKVGGRPAVYMVWPPLSREAEWSAVTASYTAAADAVDGLLLPVGEALRAVRRACFTRKRSAAAGVRLPSRRRSPPACPTYPAYAVPWLREGARYRSAHTGI